MPTSIATPGRQPAGAAGLPRPARVRPRTLPELASRLRLSGAGLADVRFQGVSQDSRAVRTADLYVARAGARTHGAAHAASARQAGAVAALTDEAGADRCRAAGLPTLVHPDPQAVLGEVSSWVYGEPTSRLTMAGVTGTNGKTTVAYLLQAAFERAGRVPGLVGTVETRVGTQRVPSLRTTPEAPELHALFAVMLERGVDTVAMEVSSYALAFGRVDGIRFDVAGFTTLARDHLDVHGDLESYFAAKAALFVPERTRIGVVNVDDEHGARLARQARIEVVTVSPSGHRDADWRGEQPTLGPGGEPRWWLRGPNGRRLPLRLAMAGAFNAANGAVAAAMLAALGVPDEAIVAGLADATVPGRMERVGGPGDPAVFVDYAHTPDAVAAVCAAARGWTSGRLLAVLGCGGDRDREKRPLMGAAAARSCDAVVVTDDNPRSEDPAAIRAAVLTGARGVRSGAEVAECPDRRAAIRWAVRAAGPADTVLVLGKGHEQGQEAAGRVLPFDDRVAVAEELAARPAGAAGAEGTEGNRLR